MQKLIPIAVLVVCTSVLAFAFSPSDPIAWCMEWVVWLGVGLGSYYWGLRMGRSQTGGAIEEG
jgi:hypothetical protein